MPEMTKILESLGLGSPLLYAMATYGAFYWLDTQASAQAKAAIVGWLKPLDYDRAAVANAILEVFDRIYSRPLLSIRAFSRSALISMALTVLFILEQQSYLAWGRLFEDGRANVLYVGIISGFIANILSDYVSLFFVRWSLALKIRSSFLALLLAALIGVFIVLFFYRLRIAAFFTWQASTPATSSPIRSSF
jgi:hypothetical protein